MSSAILIFPHQLFKHHPALASGGEIYLIEDPLFFGNDPHWPTAMHQQKLMLHRASMKAYAAELHTRGIAIHYIDVPEHSATDSRQLLEQSLPQDLHTIHLADPADDILMKRVRRFALDRAAQVKLYPSPNFITPPDFLETHLASKKKPFMAKFYENQRKRMHLLLETDGSALGGKWSFDTENRLKLPRNHIPPREPVSGANAYIQEASGYIARKFNNNPGSRKTFRWPVTRKDAEGWLDQFIDERLAHFGLYEDAISTRHATIYHSAITPMLNIGLLDPQDVIDRVIAKAAHCEIPMNSLEGFIRQVIGWREFMHGIYEYRGTAIRNGNFWGFTRKLPRSFYDGSTGIPPVDRVIRQLLADGYCHHIERLMVLGNFMILCRIKPDDVYRWFMEMFVDSYDWVMVPNVYGMSQFADGGTFTTKPYISGSNYLLKMSDEPKGPWCSIWDALFWTFVGDHASFFLKNPRLSMMVRNWEKQSPEKQSGYRKTADDFLARLSGSA